MYCFNESDLPQAPCLRIRPDERLPTAPMKMWAHKNGNGVSSQVVDEGGSRKEVTLRRKGEMY